MSGSSLVPVRFLLRVSVHCTQQQVEKLFIELHYYYPFNRYIATISVFLWEVLRHILGSLGGNRLQVKINTDRYHQWYCMQMDNYSQSQPDFPMPTEYVSQSSHCSVELVHITKENNETFVATRRTYI